MSSVSDSFDDSAPQPESTHSFEDHRNGGYNSEQFDSFSGGGNDAFESHAAGEEFAPEENGKEIGGVDSPIWGSPMEMEPEEGLALREWRTENAKILEEKEKREKELLSQIIEEADQFKVEFYKKREISCENKKATNREKEKEFVANQEKFHVEADKSYWKTIAELIPKEVPTIETKRGKKDQEKKPGIVVIQGPKPGKPTDLSRMRQILIKLKHNTPPHLKHSPPPPPEALPKDAKPNGDASATSSVKAAVTAPEATVAA